ncbi:DUF475 domain-containing protein [Candidatus Woesearchaeota archaeon]|nr:DUF475 domain-containing protein [Candidatus Woesearchaeota archaeon]
MDLWGILVIVLGLSLFEIITSIDNAVINAEVLSTMSQRARRWFLIWGLLIAVFLVRGALPWLIVWFTNFQLGPIGAFTATFSNNPAVTESIEMSKPILLMGGGVFLFLVFMHWLFLEPKYFGLRPERFFHRHGLWFFAAASVFLVAVTWVSIKVHPLISFAAVVGSSAFFITHGFKENAEQAEKNLLSKETKLSDWSKILYLEVIDASFSIDGVLGAFAFTLSVPLILFGNGIGAVVLRQLTVSNIDRIKKYKYLKNGAMYSILFLGFIMMYDSLGGHIPEWFSPIVTFGTVGFFLWKSIRENKKDEAEAAQKKKK